jgi:hypothetical protein
MLRVVVTDPDRLDKIDGEIHDWFFDLDDISLDRTRAEPTIPFVAGPTTRHV